MQLPAQNDAAAATTEAHESPPSHSGSDAPASPSSPGSPSKGAIREKPVKVLPCPRCESMNTKFCYYNNYSVTQPRHFCRQCQRYWTAGGTLRNVPVGGGSRKKSRHQRVGEPYLQRPPGVPSGPFGLPTSGGQSVLQNVGFQQMMPNDMMLNYAQLPGFTQQTHHYAPFGIDHGQGVYMPMMNKPAQEDLPSSMHAMYGTGPVSAHDGGYYPTEMPGATFQNEGALNPAVKPEFWTQSMAPPQSVAPGNPVAPGNVPNPNKNGRFQSSMLLNLGLNNRAPPSGMSVWDHDVKPMPTNAKNGSPPHGSSTIEEEGSTPANGYSNSGYEEGDAVSSMWNSIQEMDNIPDAIFRQ